MLRLCIRGIKIRLRSAILLIIVASLYCFYQIWLEQILVNHNTIKYKDEGRGVGKIHSRQSRYKEDKIRSTLSFLMNLKSRSLFCLLCFVNSWKNRSLICLLYSYFAYFVPTLPTMYFTHTQKKMWSNYQNWTKAQKVLKIFCFILHFSPIKITLLDLVTNLLFKMIALSPIALLLVTDNY